MTRARARSGHMAKREVTLLLAIGAAACLSLNSANNPKPANSQLPPPDIAKYTKQATEILAAAGPTDSTCTDAAARGMAETDKLLPPNSARAARPQPRVVYANRFGSLDAALASLPAGGGTICLPPGVFEGPVTIRRSNVQLVGMGASSILTAPPNRTVMFVLGGASDVLIANLQIQGQAVDQSTQQKCVYVTEGATRVRVERVLFAGKSPESGCNIGVHLDPLTSVDVVAHNRLTQMIGTKSGGGYGVLIVGSSGNIVTANASTFTSQQGRHHVYLSAGASDNIVSGNYCESGTAVQLHINDDTTHPDCTGNRLEHNLLVGMKSGYSLNGAIHVIGNSRFNEIRDNVILNPSPVGIHIEAAAGPSEHADSNLIESNLVYGAAKFGILVNGASQTLISGNRVYDASRAEAGTYSGITVMTDGAAIPSGTRVLNNVSYGSEHQRSALHLIGARNTEVRGNVLGTGKAGVALEDGGSNTELSNNASYPTKAGRQAAAFPLQPKP